MIKLACQENLIPGETLVEKWEFITSAGFEGIELLGPSGIECQQRLPELRAAQAAGVVFSSMCEMLPCFFGDFDPERRRDAVKQLRMLLSVIAEVGGKGTAVAPAVGLFSWALPPWDSPPRTPEEDREVLVEGLIELGEHAHRLGVEVWLEPVNRYENHMVNRLEQAADLCRAVGLESVKIVADTFHMNIEEDDPAASIQRVGSLVGHVHIADSARNEPGTGHVDFAAEMRALKEIAYDGWMAIECEIRNDPRQALPEAAAFLRQMVQAGS
jgi:sugar phosphate isomerase/epimerase